MTDARTITHNIGGRWHGGYGVAACPVCQPEQRRDQFALTLADGKVGLLAHCKKSDCVDGGDKTGQWSGAIVAL
jgi:hypothetical protein